MKPHAHGRIAQMIMLKSYPAHPLFTLPAINCGASRFASVTDPEDLCDGCKHDPALKCGA